MVGTMATLLPSFVVCVQGSDGRACVFKQAGAAGFATDMTKEIIFNPDVDPSREPDPLFSGSHRRAAMDVV
ncbi:MAG: hypothetical protein CMQ29_02270 [Gammaproteobacteria bacterium]|nr:hypothetical protein [Gammaproteobacteria bacterium]